MADLSEHLIWVLTEGCFFLLYYSTRALIDLSYHMGGGGFVFLLAADAVINNLDRETGVDIGTDSNLSLVLRIHTY
jgi:hypothetical protein